MKRILKAIGIIAVLLVLYLVAQTFVTFMLAVIQLIRLIVPALSMGAQPDINQAVQDLMKYIGQQTPWVLILSIAITLPTYFLIYQHRRQELRTFVSVRGVGAVSVPVLIILALSVNFIIEFILAMLSQIGAFSKAFESYSQVTDLLFADNFWMTLLAVGIIGPIFEEILFRGLVFGELRKISKVRIALVVQALLFGAYHMNIIQGSYAFLIGILLGYVYYRSNSIIVPMILHITINSSSVLMSALLTEAQLKDWYFLIILASLALFILTGMFVLMSRNFKRPMDNALYETNRVTKLPPEGFGQNGPAN